MFLLKKSTAVNVQILMVDSTDHVTGKTGLTLTITANKDGAAFASISPTVTELSYGVYSLALTTTHTNTTGCLWLHVTGTGADPCDVKFQVLDNLPGELSSSTLTSITNGFWDEAMSGHTTSGTFGAQIGTKLLTVAKFLGLK